MESHSCKLSPPVIKKDATKSNNRHDQVVDVPKQEGGELLMKRIKMLSCTDSNNRHKKTNTNNEKMIHECFP